MTSLSRKRALIHYLDDPRSMVLYLRWLNKSRNGEIRGLNRDFIVFNEVAH